MILIKRRRRRRNEVSLVNEEIARLELQRVNLPFLQIARLARKTVLERGRRKR